MAAKSENDLQGTLFDISALLDTNAKLAEEVAHNGVTGDTDFSMAKVHAVERLSRQVQHMLNVAADEVATHG